MPHLVRLLCVCMENTCRNPLAASVASALLEPHVQAARAGITATGHPTAPDAIAVLQQRCGIDLTPHRSWHLRGVTLATCDIGIALDRRVYALLYQGCPVPPSAVLLWPLGDPYRQGLDAYDGCRTQRQATFEAHTPPLLAR